jgi:hypothetical protein
MTTRQYDEQLSMLRADLRLTRRRRQQTILLLFTSVAVLELVFICAALAR